MIENALSLELQHSGQRFILLDEFGKLSLRKSIDSGLVLNKNTVGGVSSFSSVDGRSNRVKVSRYDKSSGKREIFIASDSVSEKKIGVLQHYVKTADKDERLSDTARSVLKLRNRDERRITVRNAIGADGVRGGSVVRLELDDFKGDARVLRCLHRISANSHFMDMDFSV